MLSNYKTSLLIQTRLINLLTLKLKPKGWGGIWYSHRGIILPSLIYISELSEKHALLLFGNRNIKDKAKYFIVCSQRSMSMHWKYWQITTTEITQRLSMLKLNIQSNIPTYSTKQISKQTMTSPPSKLPRKSFPVFFFKCRYTF